MLTALMPGTRNIISVELIPAADTILKQIVKRTGVAKKDVIARVFAWLAEQDVDVQKVVLGEIPDSLADAAKELALRKLRGVNDGAGKGYDVDEGDPITPEDPAPSPDLPPPGKPSKPRPR